MPAKFRVTIKWSDFRSFVFISPDDLGSERKRTKRFVSGCFHILGIIRPYMGEACQSKSL